MKFLYLVLVLVALVAKGESKTRDTVVNILKKVNTFVNNVETRFNNNLLNLLQNETAIKELSVNVQAKVVNNATHLLIQAFERYKDYMLKQSPSDAQVKLLDCVSNQEDLLLQIADNATRLNGWCNNRLAANLTAALQETMAALLNVNVQLLNYAKNLESCIFFDTICFGIYAFKVVVLAKKELSKVSELRSAWNDVVTISKIMFGQDVPKCGKEILLPNFAAGITTLVDNVRACVA